MCCLMNLLWLLLGGIFTAVEYLISSLLMMLTIIGIPFGMQTLKLAGLALWPFDKGSQKWEPFRWLPLYIDEYPVDISGWHWICLSHLVFRGLYCALPLSESLLDCNTSSWHLWHYRLLGKTL